MSDKTANERLVELVRAYVDPDGVPEGPIPEIEDCGCSCDGCSILSVRHGIVWFDGAWWRPECLDEAFTEQALELLKEIDNQTDEAER